VGVATGLTNVGIPAAAIAAGRPAWAGILFSCAAVGNLIGGVVYGGRAWRPRLAAQLLMTLIGAAITATLTGIATGSLIALAATLLLSGVAGSIRGIIMSTLLDHVGAPDAATESYASMVSTGLLGSALGSAIGGAVIGSSNAQIALLAAASLGWITAASFLSRIRTMHPDPFRRRQH
jgi:predicted MFS family arabinose efflux permease